MEVMQLSMMDKNGFISEGSGENIFLVKDGVISTPTTHNCLNGITRQSVIQIAKNLGIKINEVDLKFEDLVNSDEAFFTGTAVEITPITKLDGKPINKGERGSITKELQKQFEDIVSGNNQTYKHWLTHITHQ